MPLTDTDRHFVLSRIPRDIRTLMQQHPLYLAGGFIRAIIANEQPSDIDLFGSDPNQLRAIAQGFALTRRARFHETRNAFTVLTPGRLPVQFIHRWTFQTSDQLLRSFDFTVAAACICWDTGFQLWAAPCADDFYSDLAARRLVYTSPRRHEDAGGSLLRVRKFLARGYTIQAPSLAAVIARLVMGVDFNQLNKHEDREPWLAQVLTGLLREVDPLVAIDGLDLVDEHEVVT